MNSFLKIISLLVVCTCAVAHADETAFHKKLEELVEAGKLSKAQAADLADTLKGDASKEKDEADQEEEQIIVKEDDLAEFGQKLRQAVKSGKLPTGKAMAFFQKVKKEIEQNGYAKVGSGKGLSDGKTALKGKASGKGKTLGRGKGKSGTTKFYAIVIGRMKSKDVELGEFTMTVDHAASMYGSRWVKDDIAGKTIRVTGVSGQFLDKLLQIRRGKTLKVRTGGYIAESKTLTFAHKFHVLEETSPFNAEEFGIPPQAFRGFHGVVQGKIIELGGYEVLLQVSDVASVAKGSKAKNADGIKGKRIRIVGFYNQHADAFNDLHAGDNIRLSLRHQNMSHDELSVTELLEKVDKVAAQPQCRCESDLNEL